GGVSTGQLYFETAQEGNKVTFRASAGEGRYFEQTYSLAPDSYKIDYDIRFEGLNNLIGNDVKEIKLDWVNFIDPIEINRTYERNYSTVYFKPTEDGADYCSCTADDSQDAGGQRLKWVAHSNQFFTSGLFADQSFNGAAMETQVFDLENEDLKRLRSEVRIPYGHAPSEVFSMSMYAGPNEFKRMREMGDYFEDVIPFGWSIFGSINRWIIRPIFNFLSSFMGSAGMVILILTLFVKLLVYPLSYRMLYSQAKMGALKPQLEGLKAKYKDDTQQIQVETMKMYREFGVNPLGGCLPMLLQMPIWFALYRFFPASIEFRQASFLWATDLSSYDVIARLPFEIPLGFGSHISLFTLLWAATTLIYTYYNTKHMDFSANPAMKWMQYIMPILFLGFFNSFASGLTCYLLFSNVINIGQTIITNKYLIDQDKIKALLEKNKAQPKKKSAFAERLENAMKEQQRVQAEREQAKKKKK
ncbi:MAG: membrane protein insertase YidC, partial [Saprospiraceae bacterium]|nr:membrane protein insertase YidC [Saprospiraceae bacterium]